MGSPTARRARMSWALRGCQSQEAPTGQGFPAQNTPTRMASASVSSWCAMGSLTELAGEAGPSREEQRCEAWGPWSPWAPCSQMCGPEVQGCSRRRSPPSLPVLRHCPGPEHQTQACFTAACPGEGSRAPGGQWGGRGLQRAGGRKALVPGPTSRPAAPLVGPSSSQWTVNGPPGLPGPRALSHAGAP